MAKAAGVEDLARWNRDRRAPRFADQVTRTTAEAEELGVTGTPTLAIRGTDTDGLELLGTPGSPGEVEEAIDRAG